MHLRKASSSRLKVYHDLVQAVRLAQNHEHSYYCYDLVQAVTLVQNHEQTHIILSKIFLAGLQVLLSSTCIAELSWACGWVLNHVFGVQKSTY